MPPRSFRIECNLLRSKHVGRPRDNGGTCARGAFRRNDIHTTAVPLDADDRRRQPYGQTGRKAGQQSTVALPAKGVILPFGSTPNVHCGNRSKILAVGERTEDESGGRAPIAKISGHCTRRRDIVSTAAGIDDGPARSHQRGEETFQFRVPGVAWADANRLPSRGGIYVESAGRG